MTPATVALEEVEVDYRGRGRALGPLSLRIGDGEIVALVGPSGCGKSTALRLLAGLEPATRGVVQRAPGRGETSVVFQAPTLAPWMSAAANVALPLELSGTPKPEARARALEALERVGLAGAGASRPAQLSGGMAMRASLARALVTQPRLLMLDEPFAALDPGGREMVASVVRRLKEESVTLVIATHLPDLTRPHCDRAIHLEQGRIRWAGVPADSPALDPVDALDGGAA